MSATATIRTLADLLHRLGGVPLDRIRFHPAPGTATVQDVIEVGEREERACELIDGVLVEKPMGYSQGILTSLLIELLNAFVRPRNLGHVTPPDTTLQLLPHVVRIPDVAFINWDRIADRRLPTVAVPEQAPNLAIEVLSRSNTPGEMLRKREDYFNAGTELVWEVDPESRTVRVFTAPTGGVLLATGDVLNGGAVLPGFVLPLADLFAELDRHG